MKTSWKIGVAIGLAVIISMMTFGVAYADSGSATTNCQSQSLCIFTSVTCNYKGCTAYISNNGQNITFNISNAYPGYDPSVTFVLSNKNATPGVISTITPSSITPAIPSNVSSYITTTLAGIKLNQIISANGAANGTIDVSIGNNAPQTMEGKNYSMSISIMVLQSSQPCLTKTNTCLTSIPNPSLFGQIVTFTANVTGAGGTPTGTVTFYDGQTNIGTGTLSAGLATFNDSGLSIGTHSITAVYGGDTKFTTSTGTLSGGQTVNQVSKSTSMSVSSSKNPSDYGQAVIFTATINTASSGTGTPSGTIQFKIDGANFGGPVPVSKGIATSAAISTLAVGTHTITAIYSGDTNFATSTGSLSGGQKVRGITTITWPYKPNPCNWGQPCTFKVQLGWQGSASPTGYVTFYDGSNSLGSCNLSNNGSASFSTGNLGFGSHNITAVYNGDDNDDGCTSNAVNQTVNKVNSTTNLISSAGSAKGGSLVTFKATVTPSLATGIVTFKDGNTVLGTVSLSNGQATLSTTKLSTGIHSITAVYSGDPNCNGSTSNTISQIINH